MICIQMSGKDSGVKWERERERHKQTDAYKNHMHKFIELQVLGGEIIENIFYTIYFCSILYLHWCRS